MNSEETRRTRARYQCLAPFYDLMEILPERRFASWRRRFWAQVQGERILEVGVGTGKNMPYYPPQAQVTAVDLTPGMLARAQKRATALGRPVNLLLGDVQSLDFPDDTFDAAVATFVFCSVPDPIQGLRELGRVVRPGGQILLMEHMRAPHPLLGRVMDWLNPLVVRVMGANINRRTVENVQRAGLSIEGVENLDPGGIFRWIFARRTGGIRES
ncbi:MAG: class I SAM-dependent methyltransferase [Anaerolineales bacterium]